MATRAAKTLQQGLQPDYTQLAKEICPVSEHSSTVGKFVKLYGGGPPFTIIHLVASFAPTHGWAIPLGKGFFGAVTDVTYSQTSLYSMTRVALLLTNLTGPDAYQVDSFSRFLLKADILALKASHFASIVFFHLFFDQVAVLDSWKRCLFSGSMQSEAPKKKGRPGAVGACFAWCLGCGQ